ncbi:MAG: glycosyltransferase [Thermoplasmata archaeon]
MYFKAVKIIKTEGFYAFLKKLYKKLLFEFNKLQFKLKRVYSLKTNKNGKHNYFESFADKYKIPTVTLSNEGKIVACTIVSKNYLSFAFTLMESFKEKHPEYDFKILLCDMWENLEDLELFLRNIDNIIPIYSLKMELNMSYLLLEEMLFKYNVLEMNTAIKPFFLEYLLKLGYEKVIYFDPDILVLHRIDEIFDLLDNYNIVLTPHILTSLPDDGKKPDDLNILKSGLYNLGFIAIKKSIETLKFLRWWQEKLKDYCFMKVEEGLHVDQKWIDFVPIFFKEVYILKDKTYNVAYWNLHERKINIINDTLTIDGEPIKFFHFSGFSVDNESSISKHQNRFTLKDLKELNNLFILYRNKLIRNGYYYFLQKKYYFDYFPSTSISIPKEIRSTIYKEIFSKNLNPFNVEHVVDTLKIINQEIFPGVTRLAYSIYNLRTDLKIAFPNIENSSINRNMYVNWFKTQGKKEHNLHDVYVEQKNDYEKYIGSREFGVNLYGYFKYALGLSESVRSLRDTILESGIPFSLYNITSEHHPEIPDNIEEFFSTLNPYKLNIIHVNADQLPYVYQNLGASRFKNKYNVGIWYWEIEDYFPFTKSFEYIDELWVFSEFLYKIFSSLTDKPVKNIKYNFKLSAKYIIDPKVIRKKYNISEEDIVFYFSFDFHSSFERKNPDGVIKAFLIAFNDKLKYKNVKLIVKSINARYYPDKFKYLIELAKNDNRIIYIDTVLTKEEQLSLINASDCFISLHRSEGLGLGILEAMYLGKCVIATNYGGNVGYTAEDNSLLVNYKLIEIKEEFGPYSGGHWAEPDLEQAAYFMRWVYENRDKAKALGEKAKRDIINYQKQSKLEIVKNILEIYRNL